MKTLAVKIPKQDVINNLILRLVHDNPHISVCDLLVMIANQSQGLYSEVTLAWIEKKVKDKLCDYQNDGMIWGLSIITDSWMSDKIVLRPKGTYHLYHTEHMAQWAKQNAGFVPGAVDCFLMTVQFLRQHNFALNKMDNHRFVVVYAKIVAQDNISQTGTQEIIYSPQIQRTTVQKYLIYRSLTNGWFNRQIGRDEAEIL